MRHGRSAGSRASSGSHSASVSTMCTERPGPVTKHTDRVPGHRRDPSRCRISAGTFPSGFWRHVKTHCRHEARILARVNQTFRRDTMSVDQALHRRKRPRAPDAGRRMWVAKTTNHEHDQRHEHLAARCAGLVNQQASCDDHRRREEAPGHEVATDPHDVSKVQGRDRPKSSATRRCGNRAASTAMPTMTSVDGSTCHEFNRYATP